MARPRPSAAKKRAENTSTRPDRDRTDKPRITQQRPSAARKTAAAFPTPRLKSRFRKVKPRVSGWTGAKPPTAAPGGTIRMLIKFSSSAWEGPIKGVPEELIERWRRIEAGHLPAGDEVKPAPTVDQVDETEAHAITAIEAWGREAEDQIRENADEQRREIERQADEFDDQADQAESPTRASLRRRANKLREKAEEVHQDAQREMDTVADQVREHRAEMRADLRRQVEAAQQRETERIAELKAGLAAEMLNAANKYYFHKHAADGIDSWEIN